jgi:purine-binding chemotaxis protein CheW
MSLFCTFYLDGRCFGIEVVKVQEVIRAQPLTPVPLAPPVISGLINLRGQIVLAIDLRRRLEMADRAAGVPPMNVIVRDEESTISLLVDEIGDVIDVAEDTFEPPPDTVVGAGRAYLRGAYKLDDRLLLVLDTERVVDVRAAA